MLPQSVIDGIIKYVDSAVDQHIRLKDENKGKYVRREPVIHCNDNVLMFVFSYENRCLEESYDYDSEEEKEEE